MRPNSFFIWNRIKSEFDKEMNKRNVEEVYFPMVLPQSVLEKEKKHIEGFAPEVAWITQYGENKLSEKIAVRPTSETIMYPYISKWVQGHRDLPIKINQWCNVLRWEVKSCLPFIRGREFLWQEGHTSFANKEEAKAEVIDILGVYERIYKDLLAVPLIAGTKSIAETFAGAEYTLTLEAFIPQTGRGIQAATAHHLGDNFARIFDISFLDELNNKQFVYQNCWGLTTRSIGVSLMIHSDNKGAVLPPFVAKHQIQIVICGIKKATTDDEKNSLLKYATDLNNKLKAKQIRSHVDDREYITPGNKFNDGELLGIPMRIEIGVNEMKNKEVKIVERFTKNKYFLSFEELIERVEEIFKEINNKMFDEAKKCRDSSIVEVNNLVEFKKALDRNSLILAEWCTEETCEENLRVATEIIENENIVSRGAKSLCIPFDYQKKDLTNCFLCGKISKKIGLFGHSY